MGKQRDLYGTDPATKAPSRRSLLDKQRAISTARNLSHSKFGNALLTNNVQEGRVLTSAMDRLEREHRRRQMHMDQARKQFIQQQLQLPEPTLIVERPPSPEAIRKHLYSSASEDAPVTHSLNEPSYMHGLRSKARTPSLLPTIDAFSVKVKKKVNVWEEAMLEREKPRFTSVVQPCWPLTEAEQVDLRRGWEVHSRPRANFTPNADTNKQLEGTDNKLAKKPRSATKILALPPPECTKAEHNVRGKKKRIQLPAETLLTVPPPDGSPSPAFITELPAAASQDHTDQEKEHNPDKCVKFTDNVLSGTEDVPDTSEETPCHAKPGSGRVKRSRRRRKASTPQSITPTRTTILRANSGKKDAQTDFGHPKKTHKSSKMNSVNDLEAIREIMKY